MALQLVTEILSDLETPELRKLVNDGQDEFGEIKFYFDPFLNRGRFSFVYPKSKLYGGCEFEYLDSLIQFRIIDWCVRLLPRFEKPDTLREVLVKSGENSVEGLNKVYCKFLNVYV